jgi:hypothetical protein
MAKSLKVRKIGNSYGLILSKEMLDELGVREAISSSLCACQTASI